MLPCGRLLHSFLLRGCVQEQQQQSVLEGGLQVGEFTRNLRASAQRLKNVVEKLLGVLQFLLSFTFIGVFTQ